MYNLSEGCYIFDYTFYKENEDKQFIFVYIWKGIRNYDETQLISCPYSFEELVDKRNEMRNYFKNILNEDEFNEYFGIYTLVEISY